MKGLKFIALVLVLCMMPIALLSCNNAPKVNVTVTVSGKIAESGESVFGPKSVVLEWSQKKIDNGEGPVVLDALSNALSELGINIKYTDDELSVDKIGEYASKDEPNTPEEGKVTSTYWYFTVNGSEPKGKAGNVVIKDGDKIEFIYVTEVFEK